MKNLILFLIAITVSGFGCKTTKSNSPIAGRDNVLITWTDNIAGDFSFRNEWSYKESVYLNEFAQLSCDGFCPPETDGMKDNNGRIFPDSLAAFYRLVDTTHQFHTIRSEAVCYEWAGTDFIQAFRISADTVSCMTLCNVATHSSLQFNIVNNSCTPRIVLNSIVKEGDAIYSCSAGVISIDKTLWNQGILKAEFDFDFNDPANPGKPMYWKGKIYTKITERGKRK